jgi:hypothetical protein
MDDQRKVAVVTGASRGLGAAFARVLAICGPLFFQNGPRIPKMVPEYPGRSPNIYKCPRIS